MTIMNVKTVSKSQGCARLDVAVYTFTVHLTDIFVGQEHHDEIRCFDCLSDFSDFQASIGSYLNYVIPYSYGKSGRRGVRLWCQ